MLLLAPTSTAEAGTGPVGAAACPNQVGKIDAPAVAGALVGSVGFHMLQGDAFKEPQGIAAGFNVAVCAAVSTTGTGDRSPSRWMVRLWGGCGGVTASIVGPAREVPRRLEAV